MSTEAKKEDPKKTNSQSAKSTEKAQPEPSKAQPEPSKPQPDTPQPDVPPQPTPDDLALLAAWRRLLDYDMVATTEKTRYQRIRGWVISLSFLTASLAVFSTLFSNPQFVRFIYVAFFLTALGLLVYVAIFVFIPAFGRAIYALLDKKPSKEYHLPTEYQLTEVDRKATAEIRAQTSTPEAPPKPAPSWIEQFVAIFKVIGKFLNRHFQPAWAEIRKISGLYWSLLLLAVLILLGIARLSPPDFTNAIRIALVILPITSVALMNYASSFSTSVTWVEYRSSAEQIRSNIYLYRMKADNYTENDESTRQKALLTIVHGADRRIDDNGATLPYKQEMESIGKLKERIVQKAREGRKDDPIRGNGLQYLTIDEYIAWRVQPQINWYVDRILNDYESKRRDKIFALFIAGAGGVISALGYGLEGLVAITTASAVALNQRSDIFMYGATYGLFHTTSTELQNELNLWYASKPEEKADPKHQREFVEKCESIFEKERETWREQSIQMQQMAEQALQSSIQQQRDRDNNNNNKNDKTNNTTKKP